MSTAPHHSELEATETASQEGLPANEIHSAEESSDYQSDGNEAYAEFEQFTGLVDPDKPTSDMDIIRPEDLQIARNLRRLEIHRFEIASALTQMNDLDLGTDDHDDEDEIELTESEEKFAQHVAKVNEERKQRQVKRLIPHASNKKSRKNANKATTWLTNLLNGDSKNNSTSFMRQNLCLAWHGWRYDREIEARLFSPSPRFRPLGRNRSLREREQQAPCAPTRLVSWALECIASYQHGGSFRHFTFIDPEAGHGRTLLMASHKDFRAIVGIENRGKLAEDAAMNIAQYPRTFMQQRAVQLITRDFRLIEWPDQPLVIQIFAPRSREWLTQILEDISASFCGSPRQIYLIMIGNHYPEVVKEFDYIHGFEPPSGHLEMVTLASPYNVDFYYFTTTPPENNSD